MIYSTGNVHRLPFLSCICIMIVKMLNSPNFSSTSISGILSCQFIHRSLRQRTVWKGFNLRSCLLNEFMVNYKLIGLLYTLHDPHPQNRVVMTVSLYTLVLCLRADATPVPKLQAESQKSGLFFFGYLHFILSSMATFLQKVLPKQMNLSTAFRPSPLALILRSW